jgi:hypothetical protein
VRDASLVDATECERVVDLTDGTVEAFCDPAVVEGAARLAGRPATVREAVFVEEGCILEGLTAAVLVPACKGFGRAIAALTFGGSAKDSRRAR